MNWTPNYSQVSASLFSRGVRASYPVAGAADEQGPSPSLSIVLPVQMPPSPPSFGQVGGELWFWALQYSTVALLPSYISYKLPENWVPYLKPSDYFLLILGQSSKSLMRPARLWFSGHVLSGLGTSAHTVSYTEPSPNPPPLDPHFNSSLLWGPASYPFDQLCPIKM